MTGIPDTALGRVEAFVAALEYHGHGKSIVSCQFGHEAHWPGLDREYVPLHAGDLRGLVDEVRRLRTLLELDDETAGRASATGTCPVCRQDFALDPDDTIPRHVRPRPFTGRCAGSGRRPLDQGASPL